MTNLLAHNPGDDIAELHSGGFRRPHVVVDNVQRSRIEYSHDDISINGNLLDQPPMGNISNDGDGCEDFENEKVQKMVQEDL